MNELAVAGQLPLNGSFIGRSDGKGKKTLSLPCFGPFWRDPNCERHQHSMTDSLLLLLAVQTRPVWSVLQFTCTKLVHYLRPLMIGNG